MMLILVVRKTNDNPVMSYEPFEFSAPLQRVLNLHMPSLLLLTATPIVLVVVVVS
jgi:hypothetical protein